jgi:DNA-binding transcriptional MerR regulator
MMSEWTQFLEQTHPKFKNALTVDEALEREVRDSSHEVAKESLQKAKDNKEESEVLEVSPDTHNDHSISEIEWISPTYKLQDKIENIPDKMGFKIGEAADYVGVKQYVLRYWESEFDLLNPKKSKNGQRMYTKRDVETALLIKKLLHEDRFSIEGAQTALKKLRKQVKDKPPIEESLTVTEAPINVNHSDISLEFAQSLLESIRQSRAILKL